MEKNGYTPTYDRTDFDDSVAAGEHADAAIIASTISEDPSLSDAERQEWVDAAWEQYEMIPEGEGCVRADVLEFLQPTVPSDTGE